MSTSISGNVRLTYGVHTHNETFNTTTTALKFSNKSHDYVAGGDRATYSAGTGQALATVDSDEGLLLIKNTNTVGSLSVSLDNGSNFPIKVPAGAVNLVSVATGPVKVKTDIAGHTNHTVASVTTTGVITFAAAITTAGTYEMTANAAPDHTSAGPTFIMKTTTDGSTTGTVYELDGKTVKDLNTGSVYTGSTHVNLASIADYRFTLTEA